MSDTTQAQLQQRQPRAFDIPWSDEPARKVPLSHDGWAVLRRGDEVTEAGRRLYKIAVLRAQDANASSVERATALAETDDYMVAMFVREWSYGEPIPQAQIGRLQELTTGDFDLLVRCAESMIADAFPDFEPTPDPSSPFLGDRTSEVGAVGGTDRQQHPADAASAHVAADAVAAGVDAS